MNSWEWLASALMVALIATLFAYAFASTDWDAECRGMCRSRGFDDGKMGGFGLGTVFGDEAVTCRCEAWELLELSDVR